MARAALALILVVLAAAPASAGHDMCRPGTKYRGAPIDLDVKDADIHDVMRLIADVGNINIVVSDEVQGKVTLRLKHVAWDLAACTIGRVQKVQLLLEDNVVLVRKP